MNFRHIITLPLSVLFASPLWAGVAVIGTVQVSKLATLRGASLLADATVCDGDAIRVAPQGSAWVSLPGDSAILIGQQSEVLFRKSSQGAFEFEVESGQVKFRSSETSPIHAIIGDATVEPLKGAAVGYITMYGQTSALIGAEKGDILITLGRDNSSRTIHEGSAIAVRLIPDAQQEGNSNVVSGIRRKRHVIFWGAAIVGGATVIGILLNDDEKKVSPANFN